MLTFQYHAMPMLKEIYQQINQLSQSAIKMFTLIIPLAGKNITNNGFDFKQTISTNLSIGETKFTGGITAHNSQIAIGDQAVVTLNGATFLDNTPISIDKGAKL